MKMIPGLIIAAMLCNGVMAQSPAPPGLPPLPAGPPPAAEPAAPPPQAPSALPPATEPAPEMTNTNSAPAKAPAKKKKKKRAAKKPQAAAAEAKETSPLAVNEPAVPRQNNVNVRGKASINSEVIGHLKTGDTVTVLEIVTLSHAKTDEPARWAKITLPSGTHAWVNSMFLNDDKTVKPSKLNIRGGAGENYSVIGLLHKGDAVKEISTKGDWTEIEPPTGAYAFVAAHLLMHAAPEAAPTPATMPGEQQPMPSLVSGQAPIAPPPGEAPVPGTPPGPSVPAVEPQVPAPLPPPEEAPPAGPRIVQREGIVRGTVSIQAPSYFQLESLDNGDIIDYLYTTSTNLNMARYKDKTILVTGEEGLDERWPNTPVITIEKIQVVQ
jgi:uncharacterized protein YgiM (DUF1202 family)